MKTRTLWLWLAAIGLLDAGLAWREHPAQGGGAEPGLLDLPLVELSTLERAQRVVVREKPQSRVLYSNDDGSELRVEVAPNAPVRETTLAREKTGRWVVANCFGLQADPNWLGQTMRDLGQGRLIRRLSGDSKLGADLGLEAAQIRFEDENGRLLRRLEFGRRDGSGYQFVRVDGGDAYLARHSAELVGDPLAWITNPVTGIDPAEVSELDLPFQDSTEPLLQLRRSARGAPLLPVRGAASASAGRAAENALHLLLGSSVMLVVGRDTPAAQAASRNIVARARIVRFDGRVFRISYGVEADPAVELAGNRPDTLAFAFFDCSDPQDVSARDMVKAVRVYGRSATIGSLPVNRIKFLASPDDAPASH